MIADYLDRQIGIRIWEGFYAVQNFPGVDVIPKFYNQYDQQHGRKKDFQAVESPRLQVVLKGGTSHNHQKDDGEDQKTSADAFSRKKRNLREADDLIKIAYRKENERS